ncbi:MAG TPA: M28 family peptidase [Gaiellaceae bacterium]|nr:M28 family peptidase [Gaiellaceae bacterium]
MAPPRRALALRARPRRGSVERPINARMVRGTWLLVALPLLLAAFTVGRPQPLPAPALPPAFDATTAERLARELAHDYPDRSPGSAGALGAASWLRDQLGLYGFEPPQEERFTALIPGRGRVQLTNLVAVVRGVSQRKIVITAHRDNSGEGRGANDNASGSAALVELYRAYAPAVGTTSVQTRPSHTLVFVSTDGGAFGALGAARFAETSPYREDTVAVISLNAVGGFGAPRLLIAGDTARSPAAALVRTAAVRVLEQSGREPLRASALRQLLDLGFPFTLGEQGPFVARGIPAVTLTTLPDGPGQGFDDTRLSGARVGELGRAAQNLVGSLDAGLELTQGTTSYIYLGTRIVRGWAIELVLLAALLPFAIGSIDLFARCRRRRIPLGPAARSLRTRLVFWAYAGLLIFVAAKLGAFPEGEPRPLPPDAGIYQPSAVVLGVIGALLAAGWLVSRESLIPRGRVTLEETLAGHTVSLLALGLVALMLVATSPFSLIYLLPSLYAWLWLPQAHAASPAARGALLVLGLAGPLILALSFSTRYDLGADAPWYLLSLVAVGYVPWTAVVLGLVWLAVASQLATLVSGRYAPYPDVRAQGSGGRTGALLARVITPPSKRSAPREERKTLEG